MPVLKNARQELFAQGLAKGGTLVAAYKTAGYKPDSGAATRLSAKIRRRVDEILAGVAAKAGVTIESIGAQLDDDRQFARKVKQAGAGVSATMGKAKLYGLLREDGGTQVNIQIVVTKDDKGLL